MHQKIQARHTVDLLFTLALFCVFAVSALAVVLVGANVYKRTVSGMETSFTGRTATSYIAQKVRQSDEQGAVSMMYIDSIPTLCLKKDIDGSSYHTYIYYYDGYLRELFCADSLDPKPDMGQPLVELSDFTITRSPVSDCLHFCATDAEGRQSNLILSVQSTSL